MGNPESVTITRLEHDSNVSHSFSCYIVTGYLIVGDCRSWAMIDVGISRWKPDHRSKPQGGIARVKIAVQFKDKALQRKPHHDLHMHLLAHSFDRRSDCPSLRRSYLPILSAGTCIDCLCGSANSRCCFHLLTSDVPSNGSCRAQVPFCSSLQSGFLVDRSDDRPGTSSAFACRNASGGAVVRCGVHERTLAFLVVHLRVVRKSK